MKERGLIIVLSILVLSLLVIGFYQGNSELTGKAVSGPPSNANEEHSIGPSLEEQNCMRTCASEGCTAGDMECMKKNSGKCLTQCNVKKPEVTEETSCMEKCVVVGCDEFDFSCQQKNQAICEKECDMIKEPEAKSEEEQCIRDCVNVESPGLICQAGEGGEKGNEICQKCAKSCEHLYAGPCLTEIKLEEAKQTCNTCEHCYGKPVMGDSGEGYQCIVSVECADSSSEFGDDSGTGPGIGQEGFVAKVGDAIENVVESIGDFFKGIFGGNEETSSSGGEQSSNGGESTTSGRASE